MRIVELCFLVLCTSRQVYSFSFEKTFKPPKSNRPVGKSDDCEVLERSNFSREENEEETSFRSLGGSKQGHLVHYPFVFNAWNACCNRDKEITIKIQKGSTVPTTQKPKVFCLGDEDDVGDISEKELKFLSDYLDDVDDYDDATDRSSETEEIVIKIVEKSPPCNNYPSVSDNLDFVKVKVSDVVARNCTTYVTGRT
ncbi:hypothetical protein FQR65_LT11052 [Abscondita terminalis]|nr:hypothetical protein FQR65_LT11052 [Abscondita terminalis]